MGRVITITGPHGSWKDTLIHWALWEIPKSEKVVSSTDRLPRVWEIPDYSYHYRAVVPPEQEIFDGIQVPTINTRTNLAWVNYWITKDHVKSLFEWDDEKVFLWHTAPTVIRKLRDEYKDRVYCIYLHADSNILVARLQERDGMSYDKAVERLAHDPGNMESDSNRALGPKMFNSTIISNKPRELVLREFLNLIS